MGKKTINSLEQEPKNSDANNIDTFTINTNYAKIFEHNQRRKLLERVKENYHKSLLEQDEDVEEQSEYSSEDENGELINDNVMNKFLNTLVCLEQDKEQLKKTEGEIFKDDDFTVETQKKQLKTESKYNIKDALLSSGKDEDFYSVQFKPKESHDEFKSKFLDTADNAIGDLNSNDKDHSEAFLVKKKVKSELLSKVAKEMEQPTVESEPKKSIEELTLDDIVKLREQYKEDKSKIDKNILSKFSKKDDSKLSKREKFLRNYILLEGWKENSNVDVNLTKEDLEDIQNEDIFDNFESEYNFRFEEKDGANLTLHKREATETARLKDTKRSEKRKELQERKNHEKEEKLKEINMARKIMADEMKEKANNLIKLIGSNKKELQPLLEELENPNFDEKKFDSIMNQIFDKNFYKERNNNDFRLEEEIIKEELQEIEADGNNNIEDYNADPKGEEAGDVSETEWWYCDECKEVIKPGKLKYECNECEDYTMCKACYKILKHPHLMKKAKVSVLCKVDPIKFRSLKIGKNSFKVLAGLRSRMNAPTAE